MYLELKRRNFLNLNDNNNQPIHPAYAKGGVELKHFSLSNSMCEHITRLITNHVSISKYELRFFLKKPFIYLCRDYLIEIRKYIFFDCT